MRISCSILEAVGLEMISFCSRVKLSARINPNASYCPAQSDARIASIAGFPVVPLQVIRSPVLGCTRSMVVEPQPTSNMKRENKDRMGFSLYQHLTGEDNRCGCGIELRRFWLRCRIDYSIERTFLTIRLGYFILNSFFAASRRF